MNAHQPQSIKRIARMLRAVLFIAGATYAQQPQQQPHVVLNEILFQPDVNNTDPNRNHEWVELYNGSGGDVSLAGWTITTRDGLNVPSAPPPCCNPPGRRLPGDPFFRRREQPRFLQWLGQLLHR